MTEKLLQYLWNFKIFKSFDFKDTEGNALEILNFGKWNHDSGPDFLMAKIKTKGLVLVGSIEIHTQSSDWYLHHHAEMKSYKNVILHVVYEDNLEIEELKNNQIPTLELKHIVDENILRKYALLETHFDFIACEKLFTKEAIPLFFEEENLLKKLDQKSIEIESLLINSKNNYEHVLFQKIAYAFGLKANAEVYQQIAQHIDFKIVQKISQNQFQLESLLMGKANLLEKETVENSKWFKEYQYHLNKFSLTKENFPAKFLRLMPPSFPTIRLSQLATLYAQENQLFSKIIAAQNTEDLKKIFREVSVSEFWKTHLTFDKTTAFQERKLSEDFIEIVLINAILPVIYTYYKNLNSENLERILEFYKHLHAEKNSVISGWKKLGVIFKNSMKTQAFLFQKKNYCDEKKCLNCSIGFQLLKS